MSLVHRNKRPEEPVEEQTLAEYVEETGQERRARVESYEKAEQEAQDQRIALSHRIANENSRGINPEEVDKATQQAIKANPSRVLKSVSGVENAEAIQEHYKYNYEQPAHDILLDREPEYVQKAMGYTPPVLKPSIVLQPQPAPRPFGERPHDPQDIPLTGTDLRNAELQMRPESKPIYRRITCPKCGESVPCNSAYHTKADGMRCTMEGERLRSLVIPEQL